MNGLDFLDRKQKRGLNHDCGEGEDQLIGYPLRSAIIRFLDHSLKEDCAIMTI